MEIRLYNSLSNKVETLKPIRKNEISMYCCGPTVYGDAHVGNIRPVIVFDTLKRLFLYLGYDVKFVSNFTDVDDKIINKAIALNKKEIEVSSYYIDEYKKVLEKLNVLPYFENPKVTDYIQQIITYIQELVNSGNAYVKDGDVFFKINSIPSYGCLSNININDLKAGARIQENESKDNVGDFVLWKKTSSGISWDSPWSKGRPGWHSECCVMINSIFKSMIDIHCGGFDLKFPHHENEIAQSVAHDNNYIANIWMHNGFVTFGNEKMSKSTGNLVLAKDAIEKYGGNLIRLLILSTHYRSPVSYVEENILSVKKELEKIQMFYKQCSLYLQINELSLNHKSDIKEFLQYMCDDLNTSNGLTCLFSLVKEGNQLLRSKEPDNTRLEIIFSSIKDILYIYGLNISYPILSKNDKIDYCNYITLKKEKRFEESDSLRELLINKNIL